MLLCGAMLRIWPALVIEIVQQRGIAPKFLVRAILSRVGSHASFDGERMLPQTFPSGVFSQQFPGILAIRHESSRVP